MNSESRGWVLNNIYILSCFSQGMANKPVVVYTDFDETMIRDNSPKNMALATLRFYKKTFGVGHFTTAFVKLAWNYIWYKFTGSATYFYDALFYFDEKSLIQLAAKLRFKKKWLAAIKDIRKRLGGDVKIELYIISRNVGEIVKLFVDLHQDDLAALGCTVKEIIANTDILFGRDAKTLVTAGVWKSGKSVKILTTEGFKEKRISGNELSAVAYVTKPEAGALEAQLAGIVDANKQLFMSHRLRGIFYIGDKEEEYLLGHGIAPKNFYKV